jgi:hypothetical protein
VRGRGSAVVLWRGISSPWSDACLGFLDELGERFASVTCAEDDVRGEVRDFGGDYPLSGGLVEWA